MSKRLVPDEFKRECVSVSMPKWIADKLKENSNYSQIIQKLLVEYWQKQEK